MTVLWIYCTGGGGLHTPELPSTVLHTTIQHSTVLHTSPHFQPFGGGLNLAQLKAEITFKCPAPQKSSSISNLTPKR